MSVLREGGCACEAFRYRLASDPLFTHCCHCLNCQRQTGGAFVINLLKSTHGWLRGLGEPAGRLPTTMWRLNEENPPLVILDDRRDPDRRVVHRRIRHVDPDERVVPERRQFRALTKKGCRPLLLTTSLRSHCGLVPDRAIGQRHNWHECRALESAAEGMRPTRWATVGAA